MKFTEVFNSWQGEGCYAGHPMTFIRVAGCPVGCPFCDTDYTVGQSREFSSVMQVVSYPHVCVTGGEPLAHPQIDDLFLALMQLPAVSLIHVETSACYPLTPLMKDERKKFFITMSPKGEFLGAKKTFDPDNLYDADEVKWIVPATPPEIIIKFEDRCKHNFLQPMNHKFTLDDETLKYAMELSEDMMMPLSLQIHKIFQWR